MSLTLRVHERDKKNPSVISKFNPYIRLSQRDEVPVFYQDSTYFYEDGAVIKDPPEWAILQMENLSKKSQQQVKYVKPIARAKKTEVKANGND